MNEYFEKGKKFLIKKGYDYISKTPIRDTTFLLRTSEHGGIVIWFDETENEFIGCVRDWLFGITKQERIDEIQLAYNNLQANLKELKEIKNE